MRGLDDLVRSGKVHYIGISDTPAWIVSSCNVMAELRGWERFAALQVEYNLLQRTPERDLLPMAKAFDLAITPWAPLAGGALTGKYLKNETGRVKENSDRRGIKANQIAQMVVDIAKETGFSPAQVALAWLRSKSNQIIPIVGARKSNQLIDSMKCIDLSLSKENIIALDEISAEPLGFPHEFLKSEGVKDVCFAGERDKLDVHR
jgi:aryl-alcohol dehydrogenase-like predicted oxidoreductase